ncbi:MAG: DegT/DnrJ/EryC1/StrS family aminotransferase [Candidatus Hydrogenedentota bacterium]
MGRERYFLIPRRHVPIDPNEWREIDVVLEHAPEDDPATVTAFERAVAHYVAMPDAACINSGRRGMALIFSHLGIGAGDEVIVPAYTLGDLTPLIQDFGATVVPADVDPTTFNVTAGTIAPRITERTRAILVLHSFGTPCELDPILALAEAHGLPVVEDAAHGLGATCGDVKMGARGYAGFFSFESTKPVNTYGGGMVVSHDTGLVERVRAANSELEYGMGTVADKSGALRTEQRLFRNGLAWPFLLGLAIPWTRALLKRLYRGSYGTPRALRYSAFQAGLGLRRMQTLEARIAQRNHIAERYRAGLKPGIRLQEVPAGCRSTWYFLVAALPVDAAPIRRRLLYRFIDTGVEEEVADDISALLGRDDCPEARKLYKRALALPIYDDIDNTTIDQVVRALNNLVPDTR